MIAKLIGVGVAYFLCFAALNWRQVAMLKGEITKMS